MKIVPKLLVLISTATTLIMSAIGYGAYNIAQKSIERTVDQQLEGTLELVESVIEEYNEKLISIADITAKNRNTRKALDKGINRGVSQGLNEIANTYANINYILVLDYDGKIFSTSTTSSSGKNFSGETLLMEDLEHWPLFANTLRDRAYLSEPHPDPFLAQLSYETLSQWTSSPIRFRDQLIGWVIISTQWDEAYRDLMQRSMAKLAEASYPIVGMKLIPTELPSQSLETRHLTGHHPLLSKRKDLSIGLGTLQLELSFDKHDTYSALNAMLLSITYVIIVGGIILSGALFLALRRQLVTPITQLVTDIKHIDEQNLNTQLPIHKVDEFGQMASSINELTQKLSKSMISVSLLDEEVKQKEALMITQQMLSNKMSAILDTAADGIITIDTQGNILTFNQAAQRIFGYKEHEMLGSPVNVLMDTQDAINHDSHMNRYMTTGKAKIIGHIRENGTLGRELNGKRKNGEIFPIVLSIARVDTTNGTIFSGIVKDITHAKKIESSLIKAKEDAEQAAIAKSEFLAVMSHEIRTPMNGVIGMLELLMENNLNKSQIHQAYLAHNSAVSLLNLINDILDFSKIEADKLELEEQHFNLRKMLGDLAESLATQIDHENLELILDTIGVTESTVLGDATRIRQIFANLLSNALKFTQDGEIVIKVQLLPEDKNHWRIMGQIIDTGIGIPKDKVEHLFDKFSQVDASTTRRYGGTGLGLAIVKRLCQLMHGDVLVESEEGKGSTFTFEVIVAKSSESVQVLPTTDISQLAILVVDDNAINREVLRAQLEAWGAQVIEANGCDSAVQACQSFFDAHNKMFDIAFLDMQMPDTDGIELCKKLKADENTKSIDLIMMTSMDSIANQDLFKQVGFSGYFPKPATTSDLFDALNVIASKNFSTNDNLVTHNYLSTLGPRQTEKVDISVPEGLNILVVEDNRINQIVIEGVLQKVGASVTIAEHGQDALNKLKSQHDFHIILMDCQMPVMDGYQATREIRNGASGEKYQDIPIIAMTANAMTGDREACLKAGMNDYLTKPINKEHVLAMIAQWSMKASLSPHE